MQIGGSIGLSIFTALYVASLGGHATTPAPLQLTAAYGVTFIAAAVGMVGAAVIAFTMIRGTRGRLTPAPEAPVLLHAG